MALTCPSDFMNKRRVFRIQPPAYLNAQTQADRQGLSQSEFIRTVVDQACDKPPTSFPRRRIKPDLQSISLFMSDEQHERLVSTSARCGVSKNIFVEAALAPSA